MKIPYVVRLRVVFGLLLAIIFCLFCLAVGGLLTFELAVQIRRTFYPSTLAKVTDSSDIWRLKGREFGRMVNYQYEAASQPHSGEDFTAAASEEALSKFTRGGSVRVRYNPRRPSESFLEPVFLPWSWFVLAVAFLSAGTYGFHRISKRSSVFIGLWQQPSSGAAASNL